MQITLEKLTNYKNKLLTNIKGLRAIDWAMIIFFSQRFFSSIFTSLIGTPGVLLVMAMLIALYFFAVIDKLRKKEYGFLSISLIIFLSVILLIILTMIANPGAKTWLMSFDYGFVTRIFDPRRAIFALFIISLVKDSNKILRNLEFSSWIMLIFLLVQIVLFLITNSWSYYYNLSDPMHVDSIYNMSFGYDMIFVALVFFTLSFYKNKILYLTIGFVGILLTLFFGSRGALLPFLFFGFMVLIMRLWENKDWIKQNKQIIMKTLIIIIILFLITLFAYFIYVRPRFLDGTYTTNIRTLDMILKGDFFADNGRFNLWGRALEVIKYNFPFGSGVYGDRYHVGKFFQWGYSHNIFLEVLASFGLVGLIILIFAIGVTIKYLLSDKHIEYRYLILLFLSMNSKLLVSDSFWYYDYFWALFAIILIAKFSPINQSEKFVKKRKGILTSIILLFISNIFFGIYFLKQEVNQQTYKTVKVNQPSVLIFIEDENEEFVQSVINEFEIRDLPLNVFTDNNKFNTIEVLTKEQKETLDIGVSFNDLLLIKSNKDKLNKYIAEIETNISNNDIKGISVLPNFMDSRIVQNLGDKVGPVFLKNDRENYFYDEITSEDVYSLTALNASINREGVQKNRIDWTIKYGYLKDGLSIMYLEDISSNAIEFSIQQYYLGEMLDKLESLDFEFLTLSDLSEKLEITEEERNIINYIKNTDLVRRFMRVVSGGNSE